MLKLCKLMVLLVGLNSFASMSQTAAENSPFGVGEPYIRVTEEGGKKVLAISAKKFKSLNGLGPKITLMGMVHVAEKSFYDHVNHRIEVAAKVFFEHSVFEDEDAFFTSDFCLRALRAFAQETGLLQLGLVSQEGRVHYPPEKSQPSDRSIESMMDYVTHTAIEQQMVEVDASMSRDGQRCGTYLRVMEKMAQEMGLSQLSDLAGYLGTLDNLEAYAHRMIEFGNTWENIGPATRLINQGLLDYRNEAPLQDLANEMHRESSEEVLIVYGAGHMPSLERELVQRYSFVPEQETRLVAWTLGAVKDPDPKDSQAIIIHNSVAENHDNPQLCCGFSSRSDACP